MDDLNIKKRGRKPKVKDETVVVEMKKRGRKPKSKHPEDLLPKVPKKRGRKPKDKYGFFQKKEDNMINNHLNDNIILHLPIHSNNIVDYDFDEDSLLKYDPNINTPVPYEPQICETYVDHSPYPFDEDKVNNDSKSEEEIDNYKKNSNVISNSEFKLTHKNDILDNELEILNEEVSIEIKNKSKSLVDNMPEFKKCNKNKIVPIETNISCWWCCHEFLNPPYVLPIKKVEDCIYSTGCFCCPECATSWNFNSDKKNDDIWESYSLLNLLYRKCLEDKYLKIKFAPPRESLKKFGGLLSIEEFRRSNDYYNKKIKSVQHPIITLIPQMEEIFTNISDVHNSYVPIDLNKVKNANNDLKLKRSKPVNEPENTLENCMRLKYS